MFSPLISAPLPSICDQTPPGAVRPRKMGVVMVAGATNWSSAMPTTFAFSDSAAACAGVMRAVKPLKTVSNCEMAGLPIVAATACCLLRRKLLQATAAGVRALRCAPCAACVAA